MNPDQLAPIIARKDAAVDAFILNKGTEADGQQHDHVGQAEEHVELVAVLRQSPITCFPIPEEVFHDMEGVLDEGPHRRLRFFERLKRLLPRAGMIRGDR